MIKTGSEKVFVKEVERVLRRHRGVSAVVVLGMPDEVLGERIEAHIIPQGIEAGRGAEGDFRRDLQRHARENLPLAHTPKAYHLWLEFPQGARGKVDRDAIRAGLGGQRWRESTVRESEDDA